ncbi:MAG: Protein-arginine kinase activator protein [Syntrophomonadaceae bacterium]|nr:Protein-arginine kinase activator protein [Bacillota bacterium]
MLCQECQKRPANVHLTQIINQEKKTRHLCEQCAREKSGFTFQAQKPFSIHSLLPGLLETEAIPAGTAETACKVQCEQCGLTYAQFVKIGRFGCGSCYNTFNSRLCSLFRRVHGASLHAGKVPARAGILFKIKRGIGEQRRQLQIHVNREEFEQAAVVRDRIRRLEQELAGGGQDSGP